jgi:glycosyltransferase involved in cell wall biosynthesis
VRILNVTNMYPAEGLPFYGTFVREHVEGLRKKGVEVETFFTNPVSSRAAYVARIPALRRMVAGGRFDVVHAQHTFCVHQLRLAARRVPAPTVLTCHEAEIFVEPGDPNPEASGAKRFVYSRDLKRRAMNWVDYLVSVEESLPRRVGYRRGYDVIAPGVDMDLFRPAERDASRERLGWDRDGSVVLFPASPGRSFQKGYDLFERAAELLPDDIRVVTGGRIAHEDMPVYMNAADVVVQTSRFEASPMVIKEAMACNRPVVSTDVGDVVAIFGGVPGHYLTGGDARSVAAAIGDALGGVAVTEGRRRLEHLRLSLDDTADKYIALYERILKGPAHALA